MDVKLPSLEKTSLRESFFKLLREFPTFPASRNLFVVKIDRLPKALKDEEQRKLGITLNPQGIDKGRDVYEKYISGNLDIWAYKLDGIILTPLNQKLSQNIHHSHIMAINTIIQKYKYNSTGN